MKKALSQFWAPQDLTADNKASREDKTQGLRIEQWNSPDHTARPALLVPASLCCHHWNVYHKAFLMTVPEADSGNMSFSNQQLQPHSTENMNKREKNISLTKSGGVSFELSLSGNAKCKPKLRATTTTQKKELFSEQK